MASLLEATGFARLSYEGEVGASDPHEALPCIGSSDVKMSVCGGGAYVVLVDEREGYSSKVRWKK
jgi:hypothetical protein